MPKLAKYAFLAALAGVLAIPAATPSLAHAKRHHHHYHHHYVMHRSHGAYAYVGRGGDYGSRNERDCTRSPSSLRFKPCVNRQ